MIVKKSSNKFMPDFINSTYDQPIFNSVFSIGGFTKDKFFVSGTAVVIAPHLAITAKHVIEDLLKRILDLDIYKGTQGVSNKTVDAFMDLVATQYCEKGNKVNIWRVQQVYVCIQTDIAFLYLIPFNEEAVNHKWLSCKIDLNSPKIGETIYGFGFHSSTSEKSELGGKIILNWFDQPSTTIGNVID